MRTRTSRELRPRRAPSQRRSRETVQAIMTAAARVFATAGYAAGTTNRIAAEAGVSVGSLYEYFPNKDALLVALMEAHLVHGQAIVERAAAEIMARRPPLRDAVRHLIDAMIDLHARDRALHRVLFEEAPLPSHLRRRLADVERAIACQVADYLRVQPEVRVPDVDLAAVVIVQTVEALTHKLVVHGERAYREALTEEMVTLLAAYLTVRGASYPEAPVARGTAPRTTSSAMAKARSASSRP
jgi:AcrR family transcriptional regulator